MEKRFKVEISYIVTFDLTIFEFDNLSDAIKSFVEYLDYEMRGENYVCNVELYKSDDGVYWSTITDKVLKLL